VVVSAVGLARESSSISSDALGLIWHLLGVLVFALGALLIVLALVSLALGQARTSAMLWRVSASGLVAATLAPALFSGFQGADAVFVWPGVAVGVLLLGLIVGAGVNAGSGEFHDSLGNSLRGFGPVSARIAGSAVVVAALVAPGLMAVQAWSGNVSVQAVSAPRTMPAFVAAEAAQSPQVGTLVIEATEDAYLVTLERGAGVTLMESSTLLRGRDTQLTERDEDVARLAAMLVRPSSANPAPLFEKYGISFVLLRDASDSEAALTLAKRPELISASSVDSGQLWQVRDPVPAVSSLEPSEQD
jgi:hypothetical protein